MCVCGFPPGVAILELAQQYIRDTRTLKTKLHIHTLIIRRDGLCCTWINDLFCVFFLCCCVFHHLVLLPTSIVLFLFNQFYTSHTLLHTHVLRLSFGYILLAITSFLLFSSSFHFLLSLFSTRIPFFLLTLPNVPYSYILFLSCRLFFYFNNIESICVFFFILLSWFLDFLLFLFVFFFNEWRRTAAALVCVKLFCTALFCPLFCFPEQWRAKKKRNRNPWRREGVVWNICLPLICMHLRYAHCCAAL